MYFARYCVRKLTKKLEIKVFKAIKAYLKCKKLVAKLFLLSAITCKQAAYEIYCTVIIAKVREVRENIKRNRLIWRLIQLWCSYHDHIVISHNTI